MDITSLKSIGNLQTNYMFAVYIPIIPLYTNGKISTVSGKSFSVLSRTGEIPELTKVYKNVRFLNSQVAIPFGKTHTGEITFNIVLEEDHNMYDTLVAWNQSIDYKNQIGYSPFVTAFLELRDLNNERTKVYQINGMAPKHIPALPELNQDNTEGIITIATIFAFVVAVC